MKQLTCSYFVLGIWFYSIKFYGVGKPNQEGTQAKSRENCYSESFLQRNRAKGLDLASQITVLILCQTTTATKKKKKILYMKV